MRAVILSWEYPPRIVGQLADYVKRLAVILSQNQVNTYVVTYSEYSTNEWTEPEGVKVIRVTNPVRTHVGVLTWVLTLNQEIERATANVYYETGEVSLTDSHDWHFIPSAVTLKKALGIPFIYSVDSIEQHRSHGGNAPFNLAIKSIEALGIREAKLLLVKSNWMRDEVVRAYNADVERIKVLPSNSQDWSREILSIYRSVAGAF